ncbi:MAG: hypothetical protein LUC26_03240 [Prevotella sp.]|nr:hypothetical protein [Prevotella sp.]
MSAKVMIFKQNNRPKPAFTPRFSTLLIKMQTPLCLEKCYALKNQPHKRILWQLSLLLPRAAKPNETVRKVARRKR